MQLALAQRVKNMKKAKQKSATPCSKVPGTKKHLVKRWIFHPNQLALLVKRIELFS